MRLACQQRVWWKCIFPSRDKFFLNGGAKYERDKVERWYKLHGQKIISQYREPPGPPEPQYRRAPTFPEFVRYLVDLPPKRYTVHA